MRTSPSDSQFRERVRQSFSRQVLMSYIGATLQSVEPGEVAIALKPSVNLTQQHGYLHAGVVTSIVDSACGYAAYTLMPAEADVVSVEFKVNMLAPAVGDSFIARGRVIRAGKTLTVCQGDVYASSAAGERHVAMMVATMMRVARAE
ncbi:PaaI family thioesterase [soil metagenome]